jgi:hypothetical protein
MKKLNCIIVLMLTLAMLMCFAGCTQNPPADSDDIASGSPGETGESDVTEPEPPEEPSFVKHESIQSALPSPGDATVTLTGDETVDLTGIPLTGRKEIILNGYTLTFTGAYGISADAVLDIKPGEGAAEGTLDMTGMTFDFEFLTEELPPEKALVEIRPGVMIVEPEYPEGVSKREFPDILTAIQCD